MSNQTLQAADSRRRARLALLMATVAVVAACGGGGSDSPAPAPTPNTAPIAVSSIGPRSATTGTAFSLATASFFSDANGDTLSYTVTGLPAGLSISASTGVISGTPTVASATGSPYTVTITAADGRGGSVAQAFTLTVTLGANNAPARVGTITTQNGVEGTAFSLATAGFFNDPDGETLTFGATGLPNGVSINTSTGQISGTPASGTAAGSPYAVVVTATDPRGGSITQSFTLNVAAVGTGITVSGIARYESVPNLRSSNGRLDYTAITAKPIRGATVELVQGTAASPGAVVATTQTDATGAYSFTMSSAVQVFVRVRAEYKRTGPSGGTWNFAVRDNTSGNAMYALDSASFTPATGVNTRDVTAGSGWGGSSYTGTRAAGPFSVLDVAYAATNKVLSASPNAVFQPLNMYWSVNNVPAGGNLAGGLIGTSFFQRQGSNFSLYLLGAANNDSDEYDTSVVAHEYGHYFQSAFARDDSLGGQHGSGDLLDMRVAFSEGWGNGWAGMVTGDPRYADSFGAGQASGFILDVSGTARDSAPGWYSETSVQHLFWTWHQNASIGFAPIFNVLTGSMLTDSGLTSIFGFASRLKEAVPAQASTITANLAGRSINGTDSFGAGETNSGGIAQALPVYKTLNVGTTTNVCLTDAGGAYNKLGGQAYLRFSTTGAHTITVAQTSTTGGNADPDLTLLRSDGTKSVFESDTGTSETTGAVTYGSGNHVLVVYDWKFSQGQTSGQRCFDVTLN